MTKKNIIVTGANSFLGMRLINRLALSGWTPIAVVRKKCGIGVEHIHKDIQLFELPDPSQWIDFFSSFMPCAAVHLAHSTYDVGCNANSLLEMSMSNIHLPLCLAKGLYKAGNLQETKKLITVGSHWQTYGGKKYSPLNFYAGFKQGLTEILRGFTQEAENLSVTSLRLGDVYGKGDHRPKILNLMINALRNNELLEVTPGNQLVTLIHVDDVVSAFLSALELSHTSTVLEFDVFTNESITIKQLVGLIESISKKKINTVWGAKPYRKKEVFKIGVPRQVPNWVPAIDLVEGLSDILAESKTS